MKKNFEVSFHSNSDLNLDLNWTLICVLFKKYQYEERTYSVQNKTYSCTGSRTSRKSCTEKEHLLTAYKGLR